MPRLITTELLQKSAFPLNAIKEDAEHPLHDDRHGGKLKNYNMKNLALFASIVMPKQKSEKITDEFKIPEFAVEKYPFLRQVKDVPPFDKSTIARTVNSESSTSDADFPIEIYFRWDGCERPLGICIRIPLFEDETEARSVNGSGRALVKVANGRVCLKPDRRIYFSNQTVPVTEDINLGSDVAKRFGFASVIIKKGLYKMRFDSDKVNGEVYLDAITL